ncbi:MAG: hypothetical protein AAGI52_12110 [Bacteroidota bacterium]
MRALSFLLALATFAGCSGPGLAPPGCEALVLDLELGTLNGLKPTASMDEVKTQFPCSTGETEEGSAFNFGGGVFFLDHGFFAYTHRDFLEVRESFAGTTRPEALGQPLSILGEPDRMDEGAALFDRSYGCLRTEADSDGTITELGIHAEACETLEVPR